MKLKNVILITLSLSACSAAKPTANWFSQQEVAKDLKPVVFKDVNQAEFKKQYLANPKIWIEAFNFMKTQDLANLAPGKYPIDGEDVYASVTEMVDKPLDQTKFESHKKYIDLQYIISGKETLGMSPVTGAKVTNPYNEAKDGANYEINDAKYYEATPKEFYLFFPSDAHRPNIMVNQDQVKKLVIKIRVAN